MAHFGPLGRPTSQALVIYRNRWNATCCGQACCDVELVEIGVSGIVNPAMSVVTAYHLPVTAVVKKLPMPEQLPI